MSAHTFESSDINEMAFSSGKSFIKRRKFSSTSSMEMVQLDYLVVLNCVRLMRLCECVRLEPINRSFAAVAKSVCSKEIVKFDREAAYPSYKAALRLYRKKQGVLIRPEDDMPVMLQIFRRYKNFRVIRLDTSESQNTRDTISTLFAEKDCLPAKISCLTLQIMNADDFNLHLTVICDFIYLFRFSLKALNFEFFAKYDIPAGDVIFDCLWNSVSDCEKLRKLTLFYHQLLAVDGYGNGLDDLPSICSVNDRLRELCIKSFEGEQCFLLNLLSEEFEAYKPMIEKLKCFHVGCYNNDDLSDEIHSKIVRLASALQKSALLEFNVLFGVRESETVNQVVEGLEFVVKTMIVAKRTVRVWIECNNIDYSDELVAVIDEALEKLLQRHEDNCFQVTKKEVIYKEVGLTFKPKN